MAAKRSRRSPDARTASAFLALCLLFVWLTYAVFTKKFSDYDEVTLQSSKVGLRCPPAPTSRSAACIVGEVLEVRTDGDGAELTLGLYPDQTRDDPGQRHRRRSCPRRSSARSTSRSTCPAAPPAPPIRAGETIKRSRRRHRDRGGPQRPLPVAAHGAAGRAQLHADRGGERPRGARRQDRREPRDARRLPARGSTRRSRRSSRASTSSAGVSATYESVVPELTRLLRNTVKTTNTFESKEDQIQALFDDVAGFSGTAETFLRQNGDNMIRLADQGRADLRRCSPSTRRRSAASCAGRSPASRATRARSADKTLHIKLETLAKQPRGYKPRDRPAQRRQPRAVPFCRDMYRAINGGYDQENLIPQRLVPDISGRRGLRRRLRKRPAVGDAVVGTAAEQAVSTRPPRRCCGVPVERGARPRDAAVRPAGPRARRWTCDEAPRQADRRRHRQARHLHRGHRRWRPRCSRSRSATSASARPRSTRPSSPTPPACVKGDDVRIAGVKVGTVQGVEIVDRDPGAGDVRRRRGHPAHREHPGHRSATATWSASATSR